MADVQSVDIQKDNIIVNLKVSKAEYELITHQTTNLVLLPTAPDFMSHSLTTGKLGNSNRIMMPKKILEKFEIKDLDKKVPAKAFKLHDDVFLIIRLKKSTFGIPVFKDENEVR
jgi:hypothetical protein